MTYLLCFLVGLVIGASLHGLYAVRIYRAKIKELNDAHDKEMELALCKTPYFDEVGINLVVDEFVGELL